VSVGLGQNFLNPRQYPFTAQKNKRWKYYSQTVASINQFEKESLFRHTKVTFSNLLLIFFSNQIKSFFSLTSLKNNFYLSQCLPGLINSKLKITLNNKLVLF